ncbi:uridine phosphorylase [Aquibacillus koreensis]|uniref:Uridine phosphorylase n=1 Tax=Aquibacillus koreensis TaxID=279446 RepID=A0A9X3WQ11_9BACI|nr:uridine phosphorylase [Aquibacillus koreensis]MCT2536315.1 uridine phosphorylase [Aquibacillus koreensis]MDC3421334.1 uridine phosphorylase [Aquibacillus koreensis]
MKLYGDFTKEDWLKALDLDQGKIPRSFVIHGEWEHNDNLQSWKRILKDDKWIPKWNTVVGNYKGARIGFANVYGGPMASTIVHQFGAIGTEVFIQTGYFGGLSLDVAYGDIFIVTEAVMQDGVSHLYLPNQTVVKADERLVNEAVEYCERRGYRYSTGRIISTSAIFLETEQMIRDWSLDGHLGVDMETATTLAIAKKFNRRAIGLLNLSDHLCKGDTLYDCTIDRESIEMETDEKIRDLALYLSINLGK